MKKYLALIAVLVLVCTLFSCGKKAEKSDVDTVFSNTETAITEDTAQIKETDSYKETEADSDPHTETSGKTETVPETEPMTKPETEDDILDEENEVSVPVIINEICAKNNGSNLAPDGKAYDWIELYNRSSEKVNLKGYGISDKKSERYKYTFGNVTIKPGEYLVIYATGDDVQRKDMICLPFSLSKDGENVVLTYPDGKEDLIKYPAIGADESYGRVDDGDVLSFLSTTAGKTNRGAEKIIKVAAPVFSHESGFYSEDLRLEMSCESETKIYYTTDGSTPGLDSEIYRGRIELSNASSKANNYCMIPGSAQTEYFPTENLDKINVIRAVAVDSQGNISAETHATYIILSKDQLKMYSGVAIASVYTDSKNFFDYKDGIYMLGVDYDNYMKNNFDPSKLASLRPANYTRSGIEAEKPAALEFFDTDGTLGISQSVGIRISGNASRANRQKSFKIYARGEYGKGSFEYPIFEGVNDYDSFVLRSGGNDWNKAKIRDILAQTLVSDRSLVTSKWKPCAMFFNGEYWGVYLLMQRYDDRFFADTYGVDKDEVVFYKNGKIQAGTGNDYNLFKTLRDFVKNNDMTKDENYKKLCSMIDMKSYIEYACLGLIINNTDWPGNNVGFWRTRTVDESNPYADGKWRFVCFDMDLSMTPGTVDGNTYTKMLSKSLIFQYVYKNADFAKQFRNTLDEMLKNDFAINKIDTLLDYYEGILGKQMILNKKRYNTTANYSNELSQIHKFFETRANYVIKYTDEVFGKK